MEAIRAMKSFLIIWAGQSVSLMGSGLTRFALGVWVYQESRSVIDFSLIMLFSLLPDIILSPFAGTVADRWDRRRVMIVSDAGAGVSTALLVLLIFTGELAIWHVYVIVTMNAVFSAFQQPAYAAVMPMLVPKAYLDRANGFVQIDLAITRLIVPAMAGVLIGIIGLQGIMIIDAATFLFAMGTLFAIQLPKLEQEENSDQKNSIWQDMKDGWAYLWDRPSLLLVILLITLVFLVMGGATATFTPLALNVTTAQGLGFMWSVAGIGIFISSALISARGLRANRMNGILGFGFLLGLGTFFVGFNPSPYVVTFGLFIVFASLPYFQASSQTLLQNKVEPTIQGRVFALRNMIVTLPLPLVYIFVGSVSDSFLEPLLTGGGALVNSVGQLIGIGAGRGIAFLFVLMGLFLMFTIVLGYLYKPLRLVEERLPDVVNLADESPKGDEA